MAWLSAATAARSAGGHAGGMYVAHGIIGVISKRSSISALKQHGINSSRMAYAVGGRHRKSAAWQRVAKAAKRGVIKGGEAKNNDS